MGQGQCITSGFCIGLLAFACLIAIIPSTALKISQKQYSHRAHVGYPAVRYATPIVPSLKKSCRRRLWTIKSSWIPATTQTLLPKPSRLGSPLSWPPPRSSLRVKALSSNYSIQQFDPIGIVLVDHGSKKKESNDMLLKFAQLYQEVSQRDIIETAHMEIAPPSIPEAIEKCISKGAKSIVIAPYFLSKGRHVQIDIPEIVEDARASYPDLPIRLAEPLGMDKLIAQVIEDRVSQAIMK